MSADIIDVMGYKVSTSIEDLNTNGPKTIINTINPHSYCVAEKDKVFKNALLASDVLIPDGVGIVLAARFLKGKAIQKIAGYDLFVHLMKVLQKESGSCFFLGASQITLDKIKERASVDYSNVKVNSYSPPYKAQFSEDDNKLMSERVNQYKPNVLFVGMTAPKQEKWVYENKDNLDTTIICSIGAVFDFYAGTVKRPNKFWIKLGLEWLPRFLKEPKRLAERNLVSTPKFLIEMLKAKL